MNNFKNILGLHQDFDGNQAQNMTIQPIAPEDIAEIVFRESQIGWDTDYRHYAVFTGEEVKYLAYVGEGSGGGITPTDGVLEWDEAGSRYMPYTAKKLVDPGFAYFHTENINAAPFGNNLTLDGGLVTGGIQIQNLPANKWVNVDTTIGFWQYNQGSSVYLYVLASDSVYLIGDGGGDQPYLPVKIGGFYNVPAYGRHNEHIIIDDYNQLFNINMTNVRLNKGTANKWLALDSNKNIIYLDTPTISQYWAKNGNNLYPANELTDYLSFTCHSATTPFYLRGTNSYTTFSCVSDIGQAASFNVYPTSRDTVVPVITLQRQVNDPERALSGVGLYINFALMTTTSSTNESGRIVNKWTDATYATRTSSFEWWLANNTVMAKKMELSGPGSLDTLRGQYHYHSISIGADTAGDWRTYSTDTGFYTEYCTVGNATKGAGTWVNKHTITI
jgi:hypothetical protein